MTRTDPVPLALLTCRGEELIITTNQSPRSLTSQLGNRIRTIRAEVFGNQPLEDVAECMGVGLNDWMIYEAVGEGIPAQTLLRFIERTGANPLWLLTGEGTKFRPGHGALEGASHNSKPVSSHLDLKDSVQRSS